MSTTSGWRRLSVLFVAREHGERPRGSCLACGWLVLSGVVLFGGIGLIFVTTRRDTGAAVTTGLLPALMPLAGVLILRGLTTVSPRPARVVQLFGRYCVSW